MYSYNPYYYEYLAHHGVKGMRWGIRRYQPYTHGQKGIFKNLKKSYKKGVRSLKKQAKSYEKEGDELSAKGIEKRIKNLKDSYKSDKKELKSQFDSENYEAFKDKVAKSGSEKMVTKFREDLDADQLEYAVKRLQANKDLQKVALRDVEQEVKVEQAVEKMKAIAQGAQTVSSVAAAVSNVKNALGYKSKYQKELDKANLDKAKAIAIQQKAKAIEARDALKAKKDGKDNTASDSTNKPKDNKDQTTSTQNESAKSDKKKKYKIEDERINTMLKNARDAQNEENRNRLTYLTKLYSTANADTTYGKDQQGYSEIARRINNKYGSSDSSYTNNIDNVENFKSAYSSIKKSIRTNKNVSNHDLMLYGNLSGLTTKDNIDHVLEYFSTNQPPKGSDAYALWASAAALKRDLYMKTHN